MSEQYSIDELDERMSKLSIAEIDISEFRRYQMLSMVISFLISYASGYAVFLIWGIKSWAFLAGSLLSIPAFVLLMHWKFRVSALFDKLLITAMLYSTFSIVLIGLYRFVQRSDSGNAILLSNAIGFFAFSVPFIVLVINSGLERRIMFERELLSHPETESAWNFLSEEFGVTDEESFENFYNNADQAIKDRINSFSKSFAERVLQERRRFEVQIKVYQKDISKMFFRGMLISGGIGVASFGITYLLINFFVLRR